MSHPTLAPYVPTPSDVRHAAFRDSAPGARRVFSARLLLSPGAAWFADVDRSDDGWAVFYGPAFLGRWAKREDAARALRGAVRHVVLGVICDTDPTLLAE